MYRTYCRKRIKPFLAKQGYTPTSPKSVIAFEKETNTGITIVIDVQKWRGRPLITININLFQTDEKNEKGILASSIDFYRLGEFSLLPYEDMWWPIDERRIEQSFSEIEELMRNTLFPALEQLEEESFAQRFLRNEEICCE